MRGETVPSARAATALGCLTNGEAGALLDALNVAIQLRLALFTVDERLEEVEHVDAQLGEGGKGGQMRWR